MSNDEARNITLRRIFDSALLEFANNGYDLTTVEDIAKRAGIEKQEILKLAGSKYDLFISVLKEITSHYLSGQKNYKNAFDYFNRSLKHIKEMAETNNPILDYLINFTYSVESLPRNCIEKIRADVERTEAYAVLDAEMKAKNIKVADPFDIIVTFVKASATLTKVYKNSGLGLPSNEVYLEPFKGYFVVDEAPKETAYKEKIETSKVVKEILIKNNVGSIAVEFCDNKAPKMFADKRTLSLLEIDNDEIGAEQLYNSWISRIEPEAIRDVMNYIDTMINEQRVIRFDYPRTRKDGSKAYFRATAMQVASENNVHRIEGLIEDVTESYIAELEAKNIKVYNDIASAVGRQLEVVFYVNIDDDSYVIYKPNSGIEQYKLEFKGQSFFADAIEKSKKYVQPEDYVQFTTFVEKNNLLAKLNEKEIVFFAFRVIVNGTTNHVRFIISLSPDKKHLIISLENIEHDFAIKEFTKTKNNAILKNLASNYDFVTYVQTNVESSSKHKDSPYCISELFNTIMPDLYKTKYFTEKLDIIEDTIVSQKDKINFHKGTRYLELIDNLSYDDEVVIPFKAMIGGEELFYQMKFTADKNGKDIIGLIVSVGSIDKDIKIKNRIEELVEEQRRVQVLNKLFADRYYSAYIIDLEEGSFSVYKRHNEYAGGLIELENFDDYFEDFIEEDVFEPDREMLLEICKIDYIKNKLQETNEFSVRFRNISMGRVMWFHLVILRGDEDNFAAVGVINIDAEVRKSENAQKELEALVQNRTKELNKMNEELRTTNESVFDILSETVEGRDKDSGEHVKRVSAFTRILSKEVQKQCPEYKITDREIEEFALASKLHDLGKIAIKDSILLKPGKLTPEEFEIMKTHTTEGAKILEKLTDSWDKEYLRIAINICKYHHEKWDGRGYPCGLKGDEIPICAQIVSIADTFDALTNERVYKPKYPEEKAYEMILGGECGQFSEKLLKCFTAVKEQFFDCKDNITKYYRVKDKKKTIEEDNIVYGKQELIHPNEGLDYDTLERILKELPSNIFFKDTKGRYVFCSQIWKEIKTNGDPNFNIRGKTDLEVRLDRENAKKAFNEDRKIIKTGKPSHYVIQTKIDPNNPQYLELIKRPVRDKKGKIMGIVGQINDVTQRVAIEEKLKKVAETDELTGFGNRSRLEEYVTHTLPNVLYPVGIFMADCDRLKHVNDTFGHKAGDRFIKATAGILTTSFPDNSEFFRLGGDEFLIIVPGSDMTDCQKYVEEIKAQSNLVIEDTRVSVSVGFSVMDWPDDNYDKIVERADSLMYEEKKVKHAEQAALEKKQAAKNNKGGKK